MKNVLFKLTATVGASIVMIYLAVSVAGAATYNPIRDGVPDGTLFEDAFGSSPDYVGTARTGGYVFTVNDPDATITEVHKVTDATGANETIQIWDVSNNELIYSLDTTGTSFDWVTFELDNPIDLQQGNQYAVLLSGEANTNYREADLEDESQLAPGGFIFTDDAISYDYGFVDRDGFTNFGPENDFDTFTTGVVGVVDIGIDFGEGDNPVAVPTPAAFGLGGLMLGFLAMRRRN
ncbi:hypothetical protein JD969_15410 [Planctomycetota bacterium]|nr:hypothetical protein JD969_15410 [Planctomycetota bacterium]